MTFLEAGSCERVKGAWHVGGFLFAAGAAGYNAGAWVSRGEPHLLVNAVVYSALAIFEHRKIVHHFNDQADLLSPRRLRS
jgi:hypothetical protein